MSAPSPVGVIAEALAKHHAIKIPRPDAPRQCPGHVACQGCDWISRECGEVDPWDEHIAHQASVIAALNIAIVPNEHRAETRQWDGTRASIEALCRWANPESDPMDDATLTYTHFGSDDVCEVDMVGPSGYESVTAGDWIVRTSNGEFLLARGTLAAAGGES